MKCSLPLMTAAFAGSVISLAAQALPPVLDRAPQGAMITVAVPNFSRFEKNMTNLGTVMGLPAGAGFEQIMLMLGIEKGINMDGAVCAVVMPPADGRDAPEAVVLIPTASYKDLLGNFGAEVKGGVDEFMIQGSEVFSKDLGEGFAVLGGHKESVARFTGEKGNTAAFKKMLGPKSEALSDSSDFVIIVNTAVARPIVEKAMQDRMNGDEMDQIPPQARMLMPLITSTFFASTSAIVAGLSADGQGLSLDLSMTFNADSPAAKFFSRPGKSAELITKLPAMPWLVAMAFDVSSPELKGLVRQVTEMLPRDQLPPEQAAMIEQSIGMFAKIDGGAQLIGFNPGGIGMGLLSQSVGFTQASDPAVVGAAMQSQIDMITRADKGEGKIEIGALEINGVKIDSYEMKMKPDDSLPMMAQMMSVMYGPAGVAGYMAKVDGGVVTTMSKSKSLMTAALAAAKGENTLIQNKQVAAVAARMPKGRVVEVYINPKGVMDTVKPFMGFLGAEAGAIEVPKDIAPIGLCLAPSDNTLQATMYLPAPVLKLFAEIGQKVGAARMGAPRDDGAGQPSF